MSNNTVNKFIMPNGDEIKIDGLYGKITNCLLEVPQRIKLELNDGVLTLKAGSQVIVPNGFEADGTTPKFDYVDIVSDVIANTPYINEPIFIYYRNNGIEQAANNAQCSGTSSTVDYGYWYDTTNNFINRVNLGEVTHSGMSFPLAIINASNGSWTSINQIFNGMGYIGSTVWVDKGVKGLIPNGRNEDGMLRNIEVVTTNITTRTLTDNGLTEIAIISSGGLTVYGYFTVSDENYLVGNNGAKVAGVSIASVYMPNNVITSFKPKLPFRAVDYSDSSTVSSWGMPSNKYIDLTLGASGTTYTAPVNGYVYFSKVCTANGQWAYIQAGITVGGFGGIIAGYKLFAPVKKGEKFIINYNLGGATEAFRFYYAEGEV